ncbi:MAG: tetratricopeptide (TPR) repeat protein [Planctomycetota bacterium]|jgi:tetratricopeptide (TPR) repeat protein
MPNNQVRSGWRLTLAITATLVLAASIVHGQDSPNPDPQFGFELHPPAPNWTLTKGPSDTKFQRHIQYVLGTTAIEARVSVQCSLDTNTIQADGLRSLYLKALRKEPRVSAIEEVTRSIGGKETLGLSLLVESDGLDYRLHTYFAVDGGRRFVFEDLYLVERAAELSPSSDIAWASFDFGEAPQPSENQLLLQDLSAMCGSELEIAESWKEASKQAKKEGKCILVPVYLYPGFDLESPWMTVTFMQQDLLELIQERYILLPFRHDLEAPFQAQDVYGMSDKSFGRTLLVVNWKGQVAGEVFGGFDEFLRQERFLEPEGKRPSDSAQASDPLDQAKQYARRGEFSEARRILTGNQSAGAWLLEAQLAKRDLDREAWAGALEHAQDAAEFADVEEDLELALAEYDLAMGRSAEGKERYENWIRRFPNSLRMQEARYLLGNAEASSERITEAKEIWWELCREHPESRWAWIAAARLQSTAFQIGLGGRVHWPVQDYFDAHRHPEPAPGKTAELDQVTGDAVRFLLDGQLENGSWICAAEIADKPWSDVPNNLTEAISSLAVRSLLAHIQDDPQAERAVDLGLDHILDRLEFDLDQDLQSMYMDYAVWNRACQLNLFAECLRRDVGPRERLENAVEMVLVDLRERQHEKGGWSYLLSGSIEGSNSPVSQSISFTTAYVMLALAGVNGLDVDVPDGLIESGVDCLQRMKNPDGSFIYMMHHANEFQGRATTVETAAGRGPLCNYALLRHGQGGIKDLALALKTYAKYHGGLTHQVGRALMHAGPHAEGSHWVLFDYATAAQALKALSGSRTKKLRQLILEDVLETRRADGSFLDNQLIGRHAGTALGLIALEFLKK